MARLVTLVALIFLASPTRAAAQDTPADGVAVADPANEARRAAVLARIGDFIITVGDVEDEINHMSPVMRIRHRDPVQLREYVANMVELELLAREADRRGYADDPEVRRTTMESAVQQMIHTEIDERITATSISDEDVLIYYTGHDDEFARPEMRRASHILLPTRAAAEALLVEARAADARAFRALAQEHSEDEESRMRGGDLRFFDVEGRGPNRTDPAVLGPIAVAAFALAEVGDVSEPVEVEGRFSLVKLTGLQPAETRSLADAAPAIRMRLFRERRQDALEELVEALEARIPTTRNIEAVRNLRMEAPERASTDPHGEEAAEDDEDSVGSETAEVPGAAPAPAPSVPPAGEEAAPPGAAPGE